MNNDGPAAGHRLAADDAVVLMVDHQAGLLSLVQDYSPEEFRNNVMALADIAKLFGLPTILTTSFEAGPNGLLNARAEGESPPTPRTSRPGQGQINAWDNAGFRRGDPGDGRQSEPFIAGVVTDVCVAFPALSGGIAEGYQVFVVVDASGTFNKSVRDAALMRMAHAGAVMTNWFAVACELQRDWRNNMEGLGTLLANHLPAYKNLMTSFNAKSGH